MCRKIMKKNEKFRLNREIRLRLSKEEFEKLEAGATKANSKTVSGFARNLLIAKPVTFRIRNQSAEDFLEVGVAIKNELTSIGENLMDVVQLLHRHREKINFNVGMENIEVAMFDILQKNEEIKLKMTQIYKLWSQE
jgi:hypothetical protein